MARSAFNLKYGNLVKRNPLETFSHVYPEISAYSFHSRGSEWGGSPYSMGIFYIDKPFLMVEEAHEHDFEQYLMFWGGESLHPEIFKAEIELSLGPEQEVHYITGPTVIHIPKNFVHCPLNFKRIDKPVVFMDCMLTPEYIRKPVKK
jgi:hypothetical protein